MKMKILLGAAALCVGRRSPCPLGWLGAAARAGFSARLRVLTPGTWF